MTTPPDLHPHPEAPGAGATPDDDPHVDGGTAGARPQGSAVVDHDGDAVERGAASSAGSAAPTARVRRRAAALLAAGSVLLGAAAWLYLGREPAVSATAVGAVPTAERSTEPDDLRPGAPLRIRLPGMVPVSLELPGVVAPVVPVGTGPDGALKVPDPPQTVGWWAPGALAGSGTGTVVVAGHVDSRLAGVGVLAVLPRLGPGDPVVLRGADGRGVDYRVAARREFGKAALPPDTFARTGPPRLVLITCGGRFDPVARSYEDNIVVYAEPV